MNHSYHFVKDSELRYLSEFRGPLYMSPPLATVATEFIDRSGLSKATIRSYEFTLMPLLQQYGPWPTELIDREILETYLNSLTGLRYSTHHRHQAILQALMNFAVECNYFRVHEFQSF